MNKQYAIAALCVPVFLFHLSSSALSASPSPYATLYQEICRIVTANFYDPVMIERDFPDIEKTYRAKIDAVSNRHEFSALINGMLARLNTSHTYYLTPSDYEYYHLGAIFSQIPEIGKIFGNQTVQYPTVGIITRKIDSKDFIATVLAGSTAEKAGLQMGDEIISVGGAPYSPIRSIENHVGKDVLFSIRRIRNGPPMKIAVRPVLINPKKEMLDAQKASIRIMEQKGKKIGYIHIYSYAGKEYHDELVSAITWGKLREADGLIIDLRYGLGGASPGYLNIFNPDIPVLRMIDREGKKEIFDSQWRKPAVYITNNATRSGKELVVFGAKKYNYATVIGEKTAGATTAGRLYPLSNNDLIYLAVKGSEIDGVDLEGVGVSPDIDVPFDIRYCRGRDIQLEKSMDYLLNIL